MPTRIEYRIRPVTRYIITRYESTYVDFGGGNMAGNTGSCEERGEYDNERVAYDVAYALCRLEHDKSGAPLDSPDFKYPTEPGLTECIRG